MMILPKQLKSIRLVMQSLLSSHGIFTFGIIDPPRVRDIRRWKLCVSTMNKKWFMVGKFINI